MKLHEYQSKMLFARYGIPIPRGEIAHTPQDAKAVAQRLGKPVAVKAQVLVGGRGKAGGIKVASTPDDAEQAAAHILNMTIKGLPVKTVLVEEALSIAHEYYLGIIIDRSRKRAVMMASAMGGVDIEEVAERHPEAIARCAIDPLLGVRDFQLRQLAKTARFDPQIVRSFVSTSNALYRLFVDCDATLAEINPLVVTDDGRLIAADAKLLIDDNSLYRQTEIAAWRETTEEDPFEAQARQLGLAYVRLQGEVGIIGNGAGLTMTTLDVVQRAGAAPANFLDIGGGARADIVRNGLRLILSDPQVKGVLINIFGGITRCDEVARGILQALEGMEVSVPIVVRLTGTREEEGRKLLEGTSLIPAATMREAAEKIVALVRQQQAA
ncbi:Succinate--CoA ligase [GDP-forming] subunit beta [bacterium HR17]|uniref:Succinate--CoA ligase [ADP-forming] subunit beta n=1 Tax=Candidatus Fervidibacter japonicus TaxID=2035412 RepID=A0A2H5X941_9BACT|nr:Succinate--CoA ligase [GDP-forming] subunit beta [bacterium HR17]